MALKNYRTLAKPAVAEFTERKSRFIASVRPVANEAEALDFIAQIRSKYYDATHNVHAYIMRENNIQRYSDDGEPNGTAGIPVLEVMRKENICDAVVVITRYFGGVMLGAGGRVRAYGSACKMGIDESTIVERVLCDVFEITTDYNMLGKLQYYINENGFILENTEYLQEVKLTLLSEEQYSQKLVQDITELTNAQARCKNAGKKFIDKPLHRY